MKELMLDTKVEIYPPIKVIESIIYDLVIQDQTGKYYYFNNDGSYDGWSMDCNFCEN